MTIVNRSEKAQPYNVHDWKLITPDGAIIDPAFRMENDLSSGDLAGKGGRVAGTVAWDVKAKSGSFYIVFDPVSFSKGRAVWKATA